MKIRFLQILKILPNGDNKCKKSGGAVSVHTAVGLTWNVYIVRYLQAFVKIYFSIQKYDLNITIRHYNKNFLSQLREL